MRSTLLFLLITMASYPSGRQSINETNQTRAECCACPDQPREDDASQTTLCLTKIEMRSHLVHLVPLEPGERHLSMSGKLFMQIRFKPDGTVACVRAMSGDPLATAWAMQVIPKWKFRAARKKHKKYGGCGLIIVKYDFSGSKQETTVQ